MKTETIKIKMDKAIENAPKTNDSRRGWIQWGSKNMYPLDLSNLYYNSPTHRACCDFAANCILGDGVDYKAMELKGQEEMTPNYQETWDELIWKLSLDYIVYGSYALQIMKNKDDKTYSVYHQPIGDVRCSPMDDDGCITSYWISSDWSALNKYPPVEIKAFNFQEDEELIGGQAYLFVYRQYSPDMVYYQLPTYASGIKAIMAEIEMLRYDLRSITNNFSASGILTLSDVQDDNERKTVIENIEQMFSGSDNANALMISFRNNMEDNPVSFTPIDKDVNNVNLFEETNARSIDRIISSHRIPTKALVGLPTETGMLGGEGNLLNVAYNMYNQNVCKRNRQAVIGTINKVFKLNGVDVEVKLKPLTFNVLAPTSIDIERESYVNKDVTDADNVEEKVTSSNNDKNELI